MQFLLELAQNTSSASDTLSTLIDKLVKESLKSLVYQKPKLTTVHESTLQLYKTLLQSATCSDVCFESYSENGEVVNSLAHKNILSEASPYFPAMFSSHWSDAEATTTVIKTTNAPVMVASMLSFIYTGEVDLAALEDNVIELLSLPVE